MSCRIKRYVNENFFKNWTPEMSYILGYTVADGCVLKRRDRKNSYIFNITSKDKSHLVKINKILSSNYPISKKFNGHQKDKKCYQFQISNREICEDLINLGIFPRKTYNIGRLNIPNKYFSDFARGFFDGDGTVYIYRVNGVWQLKSEFINYSFLFFENFCTVLCKNMGITLKNIHKFLASNRYLTKYSICFYIDDSEKLADYMYKNASIYLTRKKKIFEKWKSLKRRHYIKNNYPSKIGWVLNKKLANNVKI